MDDKAKTSSTPEHRCGYVAIVGRPNTGKSSLFNALVGMHLSGVSPKPHTTRIQVMGWLNLAGESQPGQIVFLDTPGFIHASRDRQQVNLKQLALAVYDYSDVVAMMVDSRGWREGDERVLESIRQNFDRSTILLMNKIDLVADKSRLLQFISECDARHNWDAIVPISARRHNGMDRVVDVLWRHLPVSAPYYSVDNCTLQSQEEIIVEHIREQAYVHLHQEIPYHLAVELKGIELDKGMHIYATINVKRFHLRKIIIGRSGATLAAIRTNSEKSLQQFFGPRHPVYVHLQVSA